DSGLVSASSSIHSPATKTGGASTTTRATHAKRPGARTILNKQNSGGDRGNEQVTGEDPKQASAHSKRLAVTELTSLCRVWAAMIQGSKPSIRLMGWSATRSRTQRRYASGSSPPQAAELPADAVRLGCAG